MRAPLHVALFHVFPKSEFDTGWRICEFQFIINAAPTKLNDLILTTNWVGRSVQNVCRSQATRELSIDRDIAGIDKVADSYFGGYRLGRFVDPAVRRHVRVAID